MTFAPNGGSRAAGPMFTDDEELNLKTGASLATVEVNRIVRVAETEPHLSAMRGLVARLARHVGIPDSEIWEALR